jgi:hypothetical protein
MQKKVLLCMALLYLWPAPAAAKVPKNLIGKTFFSTVRIKDHAPEAVASHFEKSPSKADLIREKNGQWVVTLFAFFKKESYKGPVTIWLYDKNDKESLKANEPVQAISVDAKPTTLFINNLVIDPDKGFNKNRTYFVRVGQIIGKRQKIYARGEVTLLQKP